MLLSVLGKNKQTNSADSSKNEFTAFMNEEGMEKIMKRCVLVCRNTLEVLQKHHSFQVFLQICDMRLCNL